MKNYPIWKSFTVVSLVLLGIIFAIPSIIYDENSENWFLKNKINLGLDLQGGSYLLLEVQLDVLYKEELDNFVDSVRLISRDQAVKIEKIDIQENEVVVFFGNKEKIKDIRDSFFQMYRGVTLQINNNKLSIKLNDEYRKIIQDSAIKQSLEIVRKRIDESGTKEPLIQRSGKKRILLQLPGVKDPERIKDLLGKTAKLTFHIVDNDNVSALQNNLAPFGKIIVPDMYNENTKYFNNTDISVAVAVEGGLITPIVKNVQSKGLLEISMDMKDLANKAKDGKLQPEEYLGGSFSISNLGMYGIKEFSAVINPPQGCILAVGSGEKRPIVINDEISIATIMTVTLSCDHRVVDGAVGAEFLSEFKNFIENPSLMLL